MKFTELLDRLAYPAGTMIKMSFERAGFGSVDAIVERSPREFFEKLAELLDSEREAELFIYIVAKVLEQEHNIQIDGERWLKAFKLNEPSYIMEWLEKLDGMLR